MATTEILPFATDPGADVMSQADYDALPARGAGFDTGVARSEQVNKAWRQSAFIAAGLANWIATQGIDVPDDGDLAALIIKIDDALTGLIPPTPATPFSTGDVKTTLKASADSGWVMMDDGTIGDASSGATTRANADTSALFALLWNNISNTYAPVSTGRGANAAADFAAHKTIGLPKVLGRALAVAGSGASLTPRVLGETTGEETHVLSVGEMPVHSHVYTLYGLAPANGGGGATGISGSSAPATSTSGSGDAHNNMQPTSFINVMVKL